MPVTSNAQRLAAVPNAEKSDHPLKQVSNETHTKETSGAGSVRNS